MAIALKSLINTQSFARSSAAAVMPEARDDIEAELMPVSVTPAANGLLFNVDLRGLCADELRVSFHRRTVDIAAVERDPATGQTVMYAREFALPFRVKTGGYAIKASGTETLAIVAVPVRPGKNQIHIN